MPSKAEIKWGNLLESPSTKIQFEKEYMAMLDLSDYTKINPKIPKRIYCNKLIMEPLVKVLNDLNRNKLISEIRSYDGCYNVRYIRGLEAQKKLSNHSWGIALDLNAYDNPLGVSREEAIKKGLKPFTKKFCDTWKEHGFANGYDWPRKDGMHFEFVNF